MSSHALITAAPTIPCQPWPRHVLPTAQWAALQPDDIALIAAWADTAEIHALFMGPGARPLLASTTVNDGHYYALSPLFPAATAPERMIKDLWGHIADGAADERPIIDHGAWPLTRPLAARPGPATGPQEPQFRPADPALMQLPLGPASGALAEPVHLRVHTDGRRIAAAEARLGYGHKGALLLMRGKSTRAAARFAARLSADSTVANSLAFARAAEAALGVAPPARAAGLRVLMLAVERIATNLDTLAGISPEPAGTLLETLRQAALRATGHRLMMDCVVPGGLAGEIVPDWLRPALAAIAGALPELYAACPDDPPAAASRLRARVDAIATALLTADDDVPDGVTSVALPTASGEGLACAAGPRGDVWHWLRLDGGLIAAAYAADPSWLLWPALEAALQGAALADLPLIEAAFGCARSGIDL